MSTATKRAWRNPRVEMAAAEYLAAGNRRYGDLKQIAGRHDVTSAAVCAYIRRGGFRSRQGWCTNRNNTSAPVEVFKPIAGTDGRYSVSNLGRVRSNIRLYNSRTISGTGILAPILVRGYLCASIHHPKDGLCQRKIHRLVAEAFVARSRPDRIHVNHKDGNKANNAASNLDCF